MSKKITRRELLEKSVLAGAGLSLAAAGFWPLRSWGAEPLKIMMGNTFSGAYAENGEISYRCAQLAVELHGGKVLGRPIEIIKRDVPTPAEGLKKAQEAVEKLGVKYMEIAPSSSTVLAVMEYANRNKVFMMASGGADEMTGTKCNRYSFRWPIPTWGAIREVVPRIITEYKFKSIYTITPSYVFGEDLLRNTKEVLAAKGVPLLGNSYHAMGESDFGSHLTRAMAAKADCVLFLNFSNDTVNAVKQAKSFGLDKVSRICCGWGGGLNQMRAIGAKANEGVIWGINYHHTIDTPGNRKFVEAFRKKFNDTPDYIAANTYSNWSTILQGIDRAKTDDTFKVVQAVEEFEYEGLTGKEKFRACDHQAIRPYYTLESKASKDMKTPDDFCTLIGSSTNIRPCADTGCKMG